MIAMMMAHCVSLHLVVLRTVMTHVKIKVRRKKAVILIEEMSVMKYGRHNSRLTENANQKLTTVPSLNMIYALFLETFVSLFYETSL